MNAVPGERTRVADGPHMCRNYWFPPNAKIFVSCCLVVREDLVSHVKCFLFFSSFLVN